MDAINKSKEELITELHELQHECNALKVASDKEINEYKCIQEKEKIKSNFLQNIVDSISHPFYVIDANDYSILFANQHTDTYVLGKTKCYQLTHKRDTPCNSKGHPCTIDLVKSTGKSVIVEHIHYDRNKNMRNVEIHAHPVFDDNGHIHQIIEYVMDITERKQAEEKIVKMNSELDKLIKERTIELEKTNDDLKNEIAVRTKAEEYIKHQLEEREILLKEIHHRVKNNMQVIIGLLNIQASFIKNKNITSVLQDSQNRIRTMALVHDKLYQTKDFSNINFSEYITSLLNYLFSSYESQKQQIKYQINVEPFPFEIDTIIPLGLIANELISNSIKYACDTEINCKIEVSLKKYDEKNLIFSITDNGKGLPLMFDYKNTESMGMLLVNLLAEQIQGKLDVQSSDKGTTFSIIFPADKPI
jgi:two-component sensor histidine kinase